MFPIPPSEHLIETKFCKHCGSSFPITDKDIEFYEKVSPSFWGKKYAIPTPTLCPDCRQQRRLSFRNERKLYKRKCNATGENIISIYSPDKPFIVYNQDFWWSDKWNPMDYGREFDFNKGFFQQMQELIRAVPRPAMINGYSSNSDYCNHAARQNNCYLSVDAMENENCFYTNNIYHSKDCTDGSSISGSHMMYSVVESRKSSYCFYTVNTENCSECYYCSEIYGCNNCIWCIGICNKNYYVLNKSVDKAQFEQVKENLFSDFDYRIKFLDEFYSLQSWYPHVMMHNIWSASVMGDYLINTERTYYSFHCRDSKDIKYCTYLYESHDCYDHDVWGDNASFVYETHCTWWIGSGAHSILFSSIIWWWNNIILSDNLSNNASYCFWCVWLKSNASYCILNRQYTKEEYEVLVPRIIEHMMKTGEWGVFFPSSLSPFGYNETVAQEYFPISSPQPSPKGEGASEIENKETFRKVWIPSPPSPSGEGVRGWGGNGGFWGNWSLYEPPFPKVEKIIPASKLPDSIDAIPDDILNWAIECEVTKKPFRIIPQELEFYRKHHLPIPRRHPDQRHLDRMEMRNPRKLFERNCDKCGKKMITTYSPERKELVFCENCYNTAILS